MTPKTYTPKAMTLADIHAAVRAALKNAPMPQPIGRPFTDPPLTALDETEGGA